MMNVLMGFEQANKYVIMDGQGNHIGFLAEKENGFGGTMARQMFKTHRSFTTHVFDKHEKEILRFHRPFSWINSKIRVYDAISGADQPHTPTDALQGTSASSLINQTSAQISPLPLSSMRIIGEAQQQWAPLRRKYNLFLARDSPTDHDPNAPQLTSGDLPLSTSTSLAIPSPSTADPTRHTFAQFAYVNEPWLSWDFTLLSADDRLLGSVNRNFAGFAREIFTDTGVYALRMDAASLAQEPKHLISHTAQQGEVAVPPAGMTLDQRAVMLATAVSIDFDYFSRHSGAMGGMGLPLPIWIPGGGGAAAEGAAAEGAVAGAGEAGAAGRNVGSVASSESAGAAVAGAGTMVGYEAMQGRRGQQEEVWGEQSPWDESGRGGGGDGAPPSAGAGGGGGGDGGGDGFDFDSFF
ncbi:Scramblase [Macrophomina phaseolina MS6]|uniref:Phospholipid scramblase n=1 Tax=Macrophomina phaseolina (strain MS6) TaxID=1126212 RepID=K2RWH0_MACPH|nr:Scramblase [Macrophomina phaseolina MS6]